MAPARFHVAVDRPDHLRVWVAAWRARVDGAADARRDSDADGDTGHAGRPACAAGRPASGGMGRSAAPASDPDRRGCWPGAAATVGSGGGDTQPAAYRTALRGGVSNRLADGL